MSLSHDCVSSLVFFFFTRLRVSPWIYFLVCFCSSLYLQLSRYVPINDFISSGLNIESCVLATTSTWSPVTGKNLLILSSHKPHLIIRAPLKKWLWWTLLKGPDVEEIICTKVYFRPLPLRREDDSKSFWKQKLNARQPAAMEILFQSSHLCFLVVNVKSRQRAFLHSQNIDAVGWGHYQPQLTRPKFLKQLWCDGLMKTNFECWRTICHIWRSSKKTNVRCKRRLR